MGERDGRVALYLTESLAKLLRPEELREEQRATFGSGSQDCGIFGAARCFLLRPGAAELAADFRVRRRKRCGNWSGAGG